MKFGFSFLLALSIFYNAFGQSFETAEDRTGRKMLKGFITDSILLADSTSFSWFAEHEKMYEPKDNLIKTFATQKDSVNYLIFGGTWCADTHYVIPRFYKIIEQAKVDKTRITFFALDRTKNDAAHFAFNFNILHVPTIIILKNGKEIGRVVEYGTSGRFDEELAGILRSH